MVKGGIQVLCFVFVFCFVFFKKQNYLGHLDAISVLATYASELRSTTLVLGVQLEEEATCENWIQPYRICGHTGIISW